MTGKALMNDSLLEAEVLFKTMRKDPHQPSIIHELEARSITPTKEELGNFTKLLNRLKIDEGNKKSFIPRTSYDILEGSNICQ